MERFAQSNGFVVATVKGVKKLLKKSNDAYTTFKNYRSIPY